MVSFSNLGILAVANIESKYTWESVSEVDENRNEFIIKISKSGMLIIPKKELLLDDNINNLRNLFIEKIDSDKLSIKRKIFGKWRT